MKKMRSIDLFAGIGGIRMGFDRAFEQDIETVFVSEWDEFAQKTYKANFHDNFGIAGDITKVEEASVQTLIYALLDFRVRHFLWPENMVGLKMTITADAEEPYSWMLQEYANTTGRLLFSVKM